MNLKHVLLVGYSRAAEEYIDRVKENPQWGYLIRGVLDDNVARGTRYKDIKVIGRIDNLMVILPENRLDEIVITLGLNSILNWNILYPFVRNQVFIPNLFRIIIRSFLRNHIRKIYWDFR